MAVSRLVPCWPTPVIGGRLIKPFPLTGNFSLGGKQLSSDRGFARSFLAYAASAPLFVIPSCLLVGRLIFRVPLDQLAEPILALSVLHVLFGVPVCWARKRACENKRDLRPLFFVVGLYAISFCEIVAYYGVKLGLVETVVAREFGIAVLLIMPAGVTASYYMNRAFRFWRRHDRA